MGFAHLINLHDRLMNASNNNLRLYIRVNKPAVRLNGSRSAGRKGPSSGELGL